MSKAKAIRRRAGAHDGAGAGRSSRSGRARARSTPERAADASSALVAQWPFSASAALGSSVRLKGIEREIRARLPWPVRSGLTVENGCVVLTMPEGEAAGFANVSGIVADAMQGIDALPVLPREVEDILTITAHERQKWLKDGRLKSIGTRTVKLRGRAKAVTFHVLDPRDVEDVLDRDLPTIWREEDAEAIAENRKRAAGKAALTRAGKGAGKPTAAKDAREEGASPKLAGWDLFAVEGLLH